MSKRIFATFLLLPPIILICWILFLCCLQRTAKDVVVSVSGYDPRDLFSGRYISYVIDWDRTDCTQFEGEICPDNGFCADNKYRRTCRFYVPEKNADELDGLFRAQNQTDLSFEVVYAVKKGFRPMAKELLINGMPWREFLRQEQ